MLIEESLYTKIKESMPIPCVDLVVLNDRHEILMLKRANDPAKGKWWFPGGRVHLAETREEAVHRKLKQECGAEITKIEELWTKDLFLYNSDKTLSHAITTVFVVYINGRIVLDTQSESYQYKSSEEWLSFDIDPFLRNTIVKAERFFYE